MRDKITFPSEPLIAFWTVYFLLLTCESASFFVWLSMCQLWYMMFVVDVCKHAHWHEGNEIKVFNLTHILRRVHVVIKWFRILKYCIIYILLWIHTLHLWNNPIFILDSHVIYLTMALYLNSKIHNYMDVYYKTGRKLMMTKQLKLRLMRFNPSNYISE